MAFIEPEAGVEGLDYAAGVAQYNNEKIFRRILRVYSKSVPEQLEKLRSLLASPTEENIKDYIITVHGLKGSSYGVHAQDVGKKAEFLEHAAKDGDLATVFAQNEDLIATTSQFLNDLDAYLQATPDRG